LAGAFYGESGIPEAWRRILAYRDLIESLADRLYECASAQVGMNRSVAAKQRKDE
jgi:hypothetical protein